MKLVHNQAFYIISKLIAFTIGAGTVFLVWGELDSFQKNKHGILVSSSPARKTNVLSIQDGATAPSLNQAPKENSLDLFGQPAIESNILPTPESLPNTSLDITLTGTFVKTDTLLSSALLSVRGEPTIRYFSGDRLTSTVSVHAITQEAIILDNNGELQSLYLTHRPSR